MPTVHAQWAFDDHIVIIKCPLGVRWSHIVESSCLHKDLSKFRTLCDVHDCKSLSTYIRLADDYIEIQVGWKHFGQTLLLQNCPETTQPITERVTDHLCMKMKIQSVEALVTVWTEQSFYMAIPCRYSPLEKTISETNLRFFRLQLFYTLMWYVDRHRFKPWWWKRRISWRTIRITFLLFSKSRKAVCFIGYDG